MSVGAKGVGGVEGESWVGEETIWGGQGGERRGRG